MLEYRPRQVQKGTNQVKSIHVVGIDPGLVHTGVVAMSFLPKVRVVEVDTVAVPGPNAHKVKDWIGQRKPDAVFVEAYRPRAHFSSDERMVVAVRDMQRIVNATVVNNTGVKKVVREPLMNLLGVWRFGTTTHHQDLRSAARIAIYGMLKNEGMNLVLAEVVKANLEARPWSVLVR